MFEINFDGLKTSDSVLLSSNYFFVLLSYIRSRVEIIGIISLRSWSEKSKEQNCRGVPPFIYGGGEGIFIYIYFSLHRIYLERHIRN